MEKQVLARRRSECASTTPPPRATASPPSQLLTALQTLVDGERVTQIIEGNRRFDLVLRLPEAARRPRGWRDAA